VPDHALGFATLDDELDSVPLPIEGTIPGWLSGALLRVGPAKFEVGDRSYNHWFDGLAMLHRFGFGAGTVTYTNRFVDSPAYTAARTTRQIRYKEFATDPCRSLFKRVTTSFLPPVFGNNTNVAIIKQGSEFLALSETPMPVRFDAATLETLGVGVPAPGQMTVAHPHVAPRSGEFVSYATHFGPVTTYCAYAQSCQDGRAKRRREIAAIPVQRPAYMHSFGITERYLILAEFPFVVVPMAIPLSRRPLIENYQWKPGRGTRIHVIDLATPGQKGGAGSVVARCEAEPMFAFHHVNAFERGGDVLIDVCGYDDPEIIRALYLDRVRAPSFRLPAATLRRYRVPLTGGDVTREAMPAAVLELPRIDYGRCNGRPYQYLYGVGSDGGFVDRIVKVDVTDGPVIEWSEPGTYPGEPVFVRSPLARHGGAGSEDGGVLLSVVLDGAAGSSFLLVLDATDLAEIGRARVPHHIPFGFHGDHFPEVR
jgi:beta,beta-carotene 9',10'-dioxygenase